MGSSVPYTISTVTPSTDTPVSVEEVKLHAYVDTNLQNTVVLRQLKAASRLVEIMSRRQLRSATFDVRFPYFPADGILPLPRFPVNSVTSISYYNTDDTLTTLASSDYSVVTHTDSPGYIERGHNKTWPSLACRNDAVTVRFSAGSTSSTGVPDTLKQAICLTVADWFRERQNAITGMIVAELPIGVKALISAEHPGTYP